MWRFRLHQQLSTAPTGMRIEKRDGGYEAFLQFPNSWQSTGPPFPAHLLPLVNDAAATTKNPVRRYRAVMLALGRAARPEDELWELVGKWNL